MQESQIDATLQEVARARRENRSENAKQLALKAVSTSRAAGGWDLARSLTALAQIERDQGNAAEAVRRYREAATIFRESGSPLGFAHTIRHVADIHQDHGQLELAEPLYAEAVAVYRDHAQTRALDLANAIRGFALLKEAVGRVDDARQLWEEARNLYQTVGVEAGVQESSRRLQSLGQSH